MRKIIHFLKNFFAISFFTLFFWTMIDYTSCPIDGGYSLHLLYTWLFFAAIEKMFEI